MVKLIASDLDGTLLQNGARDVNPIAFRPDPYIKRTRNPVRSSQRTPVSEPAQAVHSGSG